jgi:hypothetical protein
MVPKAKTPEGYEIPVPKRGEFDANLDKLLKAPQPPKKAGCGHLLRRASSSGGREVPVVLGGSLGRRSRLEVLRVEPPDQVAVRRLDSF